MLREEFGLSLTSQAHMIGVPPHSLRNWESGSMAPSTASRQKVMDWYQRALTARDEWVEGGNDPDGLIPLSTASQLLGVGLATVMKECQDGALACVDLGPLGWFVPRAEVTG